ncbi:hypothetical protein DEJ28_15225 [Curtobacterium sp. MCPF17_002]|uniref:hypothetical protein n=1 Tax=Curtobacterium sp. MCPF17_002 TaxID=2175645 RepID=UPI000DA84856|nr:hypothetical protein [Curtobacterium sp. MCPF17_002]WIB76989.1 hypothetical protein DEJ28_15225 [Curtobacterium sp. MCPF17_002]
MRSTYQSLPQTRRLPGMHRRFGLTDPATLTAFVDQRVNDPSLLSTGAGPSYADFFAAPAQ